MAHSRTPPPPPMIGYGRQSVDQSDIDAVVTTLKGDFLTQGPAVAAFERAVADYVGAKYAVAVSSATAALHIACLAANVKSGDVGVTQPITFVASANCFLYCGARVELVDVDPDGLMMSPQRLAEHLARSPETKVIIPVSFGGLSTGGDKLREVAGADRVIIEDASHALGARDANGRMVGAAGWADMTVFSFHPVKPVTTGEGGMVVTDDNVLYERLLLLRSHGIERAADKLVVGSSDDPWWYEQQQLGFNYRLSDIQAALGASQMKRLGAFIEARRRIALAYDAAFAELRHVQLVQAASEQRARSGHHLYVARFDFDALGKGRAQVMSELCARGIGTQVHYIPVYKQPHHAAAAPNGAQLFPCSERFYQEALTLPCFPSMTQEEVARVIAGVRDVVAG